jgi:dTDP-4-dehydrorhamnose 3,5-epimerase
MLAVGRDETERTALPPGVVLRPLTVYRDARGSLAEFFREAWCEEFQPHQWQVTVSEATSLRGMHLHLRHTDYLVALDGALAVGLCDLRGGSPAHRHSLLLELDGARPAALTIPPGVAHGVFCRTRTVYVIGIDRGYDRDDELGCRWDDAELGIAWPTTTPLLSPRDTRLPSLRELARLVPAWR